MVKLLVLRRFNFGDRTHGSGVPGQEIERTEEAAEYLLAHDVNRPIVQLVGAKAPAADGKAKKK